MRTVQATVKEWSVVGGSALLDDGSPLVLPVGVLEDSPFRVLRLGQRVRVCLDDDGTVVAVDLP